MEDLVGCVLCGFRAKNLRYHIERDHNMSTKEYKDKFSSPLESDSVKKKRESTSFKKYGEKHFTNREAANFSYLVYEGGHPFKDPKCREKAKKTKEKLYGDPNFTNREKAKATNMERYGVEHTCAAKKVIQKRLDTLRQRYGKVFNIEEPHNKTHPPESFRGDYLSGLPIETLSSKYGVSELTISAWTKRLNLLRGNARPGERIVQTAEDIVIDYLNTCYEIGKSLSFYEYGKVKGTKYCNKLKRLFNKGKKYEHLKKDLFEASAEKELKYSFLGKMAG